MTELTILLLFFSFLLALAIGLAIYEWVDDNDVPEYLKDEWWAKPYDPKDLFIPREEDK